MCQYATALNAIQSAARDNSHQTLYMIEAALQFVPALEQEAEDHGMGLREFLQPARWSYLDAAAATRR